MPNTFSAPTISSIAKNTSPAINGTHAARYFFSVDILNMLSAIMPAIMLRNTAVSAAIPYIHSLIVSICTSLFFVWFVLFKKLSTPKVFIAEV